MKRNRKILVCLNDAEFAALEELERVYSFDGARATKSFLVRYGLKCLPHQSTALQV